MKYKVETSEKSTVTIKITFDKQEWEEANLKAYQQTKHRYSVNGFRKGKAPKHVIELNYGKGVFFEDALNHLYSEHYYAILDKDGTIHLGTLQFDQGMEEDIRIVHP